MLLDRRFTLICSLSMISVLGLSGSLARAASPSSMSEQTIVAQKALRLSVNDALALFINQNLDVLIA